MNKNDRISPVFRVISDYGFISCHFRIITLRKNLLHSMFNNINNNYAYII